MKYRLNPNFFLVVVALVVGSALWRQINFENFTLENPILSFVYAAVFFASIVLMLKPSKKDSEG